MNGSVYRLAALTTSESYDQYEASINRSIRELAKLTDEEKLGRQPERVTLWAASASGAIEEVLKSRGVDDERIEEHIWLNGRTQGSLVERGETLKIVSR